MSAWGEETWNEDRDGDGTMEDVQGFFENEDDFQERQLFGNSG